MLKKLEDIANVVTGIYEKGNPSGDTLYLQAKHFNVRGSYRMDTVNHPEVILDERLEKHLLKDGDILLTAKGENNRACLYNRDIGPAVASSTFFVIRLEEPGILPEFLQWYFNTSKMQSVLSSLTKGTRIRSLSKKALLKVEIQTPPIEKQKEILELQSLWEKEKNLTLELIEQKHTLYQNLFFNLATSKLVKK